MSNNNTKNQKPKTIGVIMAAGKGSRMGNLTFSTPKPLLTVHGKTFLEYNLEGLFDLVDEFVIVVNYLAVQIVELFGNSFIFEGISKPIRYAFMDSPTNGTLDAFRSAVYNNMEYSTMIGFLKNQNSQDILGRTQLYNKSFNNNYIVTNADHILQESYYNVLNKSITENSNQIYLVTNKLQNPELAKNYGVVVIDESGNYTKIVEKPSEYVSSLISIGLYYFPSFALRYFEPIRDPEYIGEEWIVTLINNLSMEYSVKVLTSSDHYLTASNPEELAELNKIKL
jgi:NDP-sugar pyrophosphorylase family protein